MPRGFVRACKAVSAWSCPTRTPCTTRLRTGCAVLRQVIRGRHPPHPAPAEAVRHGLRVQRRGRGRELAAGVQGGETEEAADGAEAGLAKVLEVAARLGDARGEDAQALKTLESGLSRYPKAPALDRARALLFRAEL